MRNLILSGPFLILLLLISCSTSTKTGIKHSGDKFEPTDGNSLFILGQADEYAMKQYLAIVQRDPLPSGFAFYTSLSGDGTQNDMRNISYFMSDFPNITLQPAIWTGERRWVDTWI